MGTITPGPTLDYDLVWTAAGEFAFATHLSTASISNNDKAIVPFIELLFDVAGGLCEVQITHGTGLIYSINIPVIVAGCYKFTGPWFLESGGTVAVRTVGNVGTKQMQVHYYSEKERIDNFPPGVPLQDGGLLVTGITDLLAAVGEHDEPPANADGVKTLWEATAFDGAAFAAVTADGDLTRPKASLQGVGFFTMVTPDGSTTSLGDVDAAVEDAVVQMGLRATLQDGAVFITQAATEGRNVQAVGSQQGVPFASLVDQTGQYTPHNVQAANVQLGGIQTLGEVKVVDGAALPNQGAEGQAIRPALSEGGAQYTMPVSPTGDTTAYANVDQPVQTGAIQSAGRAEEEDGAAFDGAVATGDAVLARRSLRGVSYVKQVSADGSASPYDEVNNALRESVINNSEYNFDDIDLVDATNLSADTRYYPASTGMLNDGKRDLSFSGKFIDGDGTITMTVEVTNDEDPAAADWIQSHFYDDKNDVTVNSLTVTNGTLTFAISLNNFNYSYFRVVVVNAIDAGPTNTLIIKGRWKAQ